MNNIFFVYSSRVCFVMCLLGVARLVNSIGKFKKISFTSDRFVNTLMSNSPRVGTRGGIKKRGVNRGCDRSRGRGITKITRATENLKTKYTSPKISKRDVIWLHSSSESSSSHSSSSSESTTTNWYAETLVLDDHDLIVRKVSIGSRK